MVGRGGGDRTHVRMMGNQDGNRTVHFHGRGHGFESRRPIYVFSGAVSLSRIRSTMIPFSAQNLEMIGYHCASTASRSSNLEAGEST